MSSRNSPNAALGRVLSRFRRARGPKGGEIGKPSTRDQPRRVWFHRKYNRLSGGRLKHAHYFDHVDRMPGFIPKITFSGDTKDASLLAERDRLWPAAVENRAPSWMPEHRDVLFLEGAIDWPYLIESGLDSLPNPRINLIQGIQHAHEDNVRYRYLSERAIRICVSKEVADAICSTGRTNGPVLTIPNGVDVIPFQRSAGGSPLDYDARRQPPHDSRLQESRTRSGAVRATGCGAHQPPAARRVPGPGLVPGASDRDPNRCLSAPPRGGILSASARSHGFGLSRSHTGLHRKSGLLPSRGELSDR